MADQRGDEILDGDAPDGAYIVHDDGSVTILPHHDDTVGVQWHDMSGPEQPKRLRYSDMTAEGGLEPRWLLMEPGAHEIRRGRRRYGRVEGSHQITGYFRDAPEQVRTFMRGTPFLPLLSGLSHHGLRSRYLMAVLSERWWDTTHTFHWGWGEMTLTPLDVHMITGLPVGGRPVALSPRFRLTPAGGQALLGLRTLSGAAPVRGDFV